MLGEQSISSVLILDLWPLIIDIFALETAKNSDITLTNSKFEAPLWGIAATLTNKVPELKLSTFEIFDFGLTETSNFKLKRIS